MEYTLNMVFLTSGNKKATFSISKADGAVTKAQVNALMDGLIAKNIFTTASGDLVSKDSASLVAKTVTAIDMN
jgi:hypothetical protein